MGSQSAFGFSCLISVAQMLPLAVVPAPFDFPSMRFYQLWHDRAQHQASHRWLRELLGRSARRIAME
jgi:DNA-binding transcriptional LysR family regulator